ncbi:MAG: HDOD domain-containing protein [Burkholderiales bacterium]|nr:HDOD domain-containing protein [Burkholderiales bacterium]
MKSLGRFRLLRGLGEGAQATVWLAHDPRLDREVALKLLRPDTDTVSLDEWLHEARAVSRLTHPNIVPVFEADNIDGQCYLVFEFVPGHTLADLMRGNKRLPAREAVELALGVLAGLQAAHAAGVVHRDLKPSNILIDASGRPRVMDFGIAARLADAAQPQLIVGTPGYISPEAARGEPPSAAMDVFAASILLAEMLAGQRLNFDTDPWRAVKRVIETDLQLPTELGTDVDDTLRAIVKRGLARNASERWPTAQALHDALLHWLHPADTQVAPVKDGAALEFLLRRMRSKSDFPAMSDAVGRIQKLTYSENASLAGLSNEILKDVALTQKLLRLVNTVHYKHAGGGNITTVSRAVALVGFAGIRNMALSLILLEHMENKTHAQQLRVEFLRSLMAANLARELCLNPRDDEESFLCAMFHNLGRTLTEFYFPEEAQQIRRITRVEHKSHGHGVTATPLSAANASAQVLGMSFEQLGLGVARQWGLPRALQQSMHHVEGEPPAHPPEQAIERQRWLAHAANAVADEILHTDPAEVHGHVRAIAQRYAHALGVKPGAFDAAATEARQELSKMARAMNINLPRNSPGQRLLSPVEPALDDSLTPTQLQATQVMATADQATAKLDRHEASGANSGDTSNEATRKISRETTREAQREAADALLHDEAVQVLTSGIEDITNQLVDNFKLNEVLRMVLETLYRGLHLRRIVFCLREPKLDSLTGRFGLGDDIEPAKGLVAAFKIPLHTAASTSVDLFAAVCQRGVDTLIADATDHKIAERLPDWYRAKVHAPTFLLLPLAMKGATFALIYADKARANSIELSERELSLLRTLRNQAVMAFKQTA